jgi:tetratricopeptide (TPR) repeat protein
VVAVIVTLFILWFNRRGWARPMLVALAYFLALLFPVLGFFNVSFFYYSFVADHFQYLASIGPITLAAAGIDKLFRSLRDQQPFWKPIFCGTLLLVLGMLTWRQCAIYADIETLWQTTARLNPNCWIAYNKLGNVLIQKGSVDEAIIQYQTALQIKPDYAGAHYNLGCALIERGRVGEAITQYQKALEINPYYPRALNNLAWTLATSPQASLRNGDKAVELAQRANQLTGGENPTILYTLAAAYAEAGRFSDAMRSAQKAIELAQAEGRQDMVEQLNSELKLYEMGLPFHQESR